MFNSQKNNNSYVNYSFLTLKMAVHWYQYIIVYYTFCIILYNLLMYLLL